LPTAAPAGCQDFLDPDFHFVNVDNIVCNPPYGVAEDFVRRALDVAGRKVAMLVQAKFTYSQTRHALFTARPPTRLYFLSARPSMPPGDLLLAGEIEAKGGKMDFMWMVWDQRYSGGPCVAHWLGRPV
jgi:hypothetical protein